MILKMKDKDELLSRTPDSLRRDIITLFEYIEALENIIEHTPDGIYITDGDANAILINKAFERISGLNRNDLLGVNHRVLEEKKIIRESAALKAIRQKEKVTIIHNYLTTKRQALDTCLPIIDDTGKILMTVSSIRDMTELVSLENRLNEEKNLREQMERQLEALRNDEVDSEGIIVHDSKTRQALMLARRISNVDANVLITGESGVGKEVYAQYIHKSGKRKNGPFIGINCGSIPQQLLESELFGYVGGAFTGALKQGKIGLIEAGNGGTVFFDEVGELPLDMQVKLLRFLQQRTIQRVGGVKEVSVDIRIIAATNRDLEKMVKEGKFREDLYYRLNVVPLKILPLRERRDDIIPLVNAFIKEYNEKYESSVRFSQRAYELLYAYDWPGNVRELKNLIERLIVISDSDMVLAEDLPMYAGTLPMIRKITCHSDFINAKDELERYEYELIKNAYEKYSSMRKAADYLGMSEPTFVRKRKKYMEKYDQDR